VYFFVCATTIGKSNFNGNSGCSVRLKEKETVDQVLIHCLWASSLWHLSLSQPSSVKVDVDHVVVAWRRTKSDWVSVFGI